MKIKTIQTKVNALTKLNLDELDFEGITEDGQHTLIDRDVKQICKELARFSRTLRKQEKNYVDHKFDHQLKNTFGKWVDYYNGDVNRALQAMDTVVSGMKQEPPKKNNSHSEPETNVAESNSASAASATESSENTISDTDDNSTKSTNSHDLNDKH